MPRAARATAASVASSAKPARYKNKTFHCDQCPATFTRKTGLNRHLPLHLPEELRDYHRCPYSGCEYKSLQKYNLDNHVRSLHTFATAALCEECCMQFCDRGSYSRHRKNIHGLSRNRRRPCNSVLSSDTVSRSTSRSSSASASSPSPSAAPSPASSSRPPSVAPSPRLSSHVSSTSLSSEPFPVGSSANYDTLSWLYSQHMNTNSVVPAAEPGNFGVPTFSFAPALDPLADYPRVCNSSDYIPSSMFDFSIPAPANSLLIPAPINSHPTSAPIDLYSMLFDLNLPVELCMGTHDPFSVPSVTNLEGCDISGFGSWPELGSLEALADVVFSCINQDSGSFSV